MTSSEKVNVRDVLNFLFRVLNSLSMSADDDGLISMLVGDETYPCMINKKKIGNAYRTNTEKPRLN